MGLRLFGSIFLIVMAMMIFDCLGIIRGFNSKVSKQSRRSKPKSPAAIVCKFGNKNFTIGHKWNPNLKPNGINYCINCRCKKSGLVNCIRVKCKSISCPGKIVPSGKCCPVCPGPQSSISTKKQCYYDGKHYHRGEVWKLPVKSQDVGVNNCAECTCHNGRASCAVRICPTLKCAKILQIQGKDSCCKQCQGFPLTPVGGTFRSKPAVAVSGSCFIKGRYYKDKDMWNPLASTSKAKVFQRPNCNLCMCQNTAVKCQVVTCPKLDCDNPIQKNPKDCCQSCPDKQVVSPIVNRTLPQNASPKKPKDLNYPDCKFLTKVYRHNSSWTPQIPGHDANSCVRCTCEFSNVKCNRDGCDDKKSSIQQQANSTPRPSMDKRACSLGDRVQVYLFVNDNSKRPKARQNFIARIAIIDPKELFVTVHFWDVADNKATIKSSKPRKSRFEKRKTNYKKVGETKIGRINRFFNKEKTLEKCDRSCKSKARDLVHILKNRVRYLKVSCRAIDLFRSLKPRSNK